MKRLLLMVLPVLLLGCRPKVGLKTSQELAREVTVAKTAPQYCFSALVLYKGKKRVMTGCTVDRALCHQAQFSAREVGGLAGIKFVTECKLVGMAEW